MKDSNVVDLIKVTAELHGLVLSHRSTTSHFRDVYLEANAELPRDLQVAKLHEAANTFKAAGLNDVTVTRFVNPPKLNAKTGKFEAGHERHGDPLLEMVSVWWSEELDVPKKTWKPKKKTGEKLEDTE